MPVITGGSTPVTFTVEVCFNQDPNDPAAPTAVWTDITQRCSNIRWSRGRQYELDKVEAGTFSATVDNLDGQLTPGNTASSFYPNVVLYRQIRVKAVLASTTYYLFTGYVSRWPQSYSAAGQRASTALEAVDTLGVLAQVNLTGWGSDVLGGYTPTWVYPLDDGPNATLFNASVGMVQPGYLYTVPPLGASQVAPGQQFDATMPGFSGRTFTQLTSVTPSGAGSSTGILLPAPNLPSSGPWSISLWFRMDTLPTAGYTVGILSLMDRLQWNNAATVRHQILIRTDSFSRVIGDVLEDTSGAGGTAIGPYSVGVWHLVTLSLSADHKTMRMVLDAGAPTVVATTATPMAFSAVDTFHIGGLNHIQTDQGIQGSVANVALFPLDLAGDTVNNPCQTVLYPAGVTAFSGERTDQRALRLAQATGFGSRFVATSTGDSNMSPGATAGQTAADALSDVGSTEFGMIFARGDGMLVFTPRHARFNPAPVYNFGELELPYSALAFDYDPTHLVNSATVSRPGGSSTTVTDVASVKTNFTHSQAYTLQVSSDIAVRAAAEWVVSRYKDPKIRVSSFTVNPLANSDLVSAVLNAELGTCVQVTRRPPGVQAITQTCFMDRLEHQLAFDASGASWTVNYMLTPADTTSYLVWDAPSPYGNWDKNNWAY